MSEPRRAAAPAETMTTIDGHAMCCGLTAMKQRSEWRRLKGLVWQTTYDPMYSMAF